MADIKSLCFYLKYSDNFTDRQYAYLEFNIFNFFKKNELLDGRFDSITKIQVIMQAVKDEAKIFLPLLYFLNQDSSFQELKSICSADFEPIEGKQIRHSISLPFYTIYYSTSNTNDYYNVENLWVQIKKEINLQNDIIIEFRAYLKSAETNFLKYLTHKYGKNQQSYKSSIVIKNQNETIYSKINKGVLESILNNDILELVKTYVIRVEKQFNKIRFQEWLLDSFEENYTLTNLLGYIFKKRIDLQLAYNINTPTWLENLELWMDRYGFNEINFDLFIGHQQIEELKQSRKVAPILIKDGVQIVGYLNEVKGLGEISRNLSQAISQKQRVYLSDLNSSRNNSRIYCDVNVLNINGDQLEPYFNSIGINRYPAFTIGFWFWELEVLHSRFLAGERYVDAVWTSSVFCKKVFESNFKVPVSLQPILVESKVYDEDFKPLVGFPYILSIFDFKSDIERKNIFNTIKVFKMVQQQLKMPMNLIIKSINADFDMENAIKLEQYTRDEPSIQWIDESIKFDKILGLIKNASAFVSLHRSEGLGLSMVHAMALGTPTVATAYSGNLDFMHEHNSYLVDYELVPVNSLNQNYANVRGSWADPNLEGAAEALLRALTGNNSRILERARNDILTRYSRENFFRYLDNNLDSYLRPKTQKIRSLIKKYF